MTEAPAAVFKACECPQCGELLCDVLLTESATGIIQRIRCPNRRCKSRVWLAPVAGEISVIMVDSAPKRRPT